MLSHAELVVRYRHLRDVGRSLNSDLMKLVSKDAMQQGGRDLGLLRNGTLVFDSEEEAALLFDYCLFCLRRGGNNAIQTALAEGTYPEASDETNQLRRMSEAWYSLFDIERIEFGVGLHVRDLLRKTEHFLIDLSMSQTARTGDVLASRLIPAEDFVMTSGAAIPLGSSQGVESLIATINSLLFGQGAPTAEPLSAKQDRILNKTIVAAALANGMTQRIRHVGVGERIDDALLSRLAQGRGGVPPLAVPAVAGGRIGRNDRCPCGSGKKYKFCCGKS